MKKIKTKNPCSACDASSTLEDLLFYWYFKKYMYSLPSNYGQREMMHVVQRFDRCHIPIANIVFLPFDYNMRKSAVF